MSHRSSSAPGGPAPGQSSAPPNRASCVGSMPRSATANPRSGDCNTETRLLPYRVGCTYSIFLQIKSILHTTGIYAPHGSKTLADLFDGRSQLLPLHVRLRIPRRRAEPRLHRLLVRRRPLRRRHPPPQRTRRDPGQRVDRTATGAAAVQGADGLEVHWVSSLGSDFRYDFGAAFTEEQQRSGADYNFTHVDQVAPQREGMSAFVLQDGVVHHTYSTYARGVEQLMGTFGYLDVAPFGRNEDPSSPGPGGTVTMSTRLERRRRVNDRAQDWNPGGVAGRARRAAQGGEGAHAPQRRARPEAAGAPVGAGGEGLQLRDRAR